jgi:metallo-beta-lactamase family protein
LNRKAFPFSPSEIQYVLLTHAHLDHCGLIPKLVAEGFRGWVYCTQATKEVAQELLADAAKISNLYSQDDVDGINWHVIDGGEFSWGRILKLAENLTATFNRGSHVLGGCSISVSWVRTPSDQRANFASIHFSGDLGCQTDDNSYLPLLKADHNPYPTADYIVTESTYGNRRRESKCWRTRTSILADAVIRTVAHKGGKVLIPSFAFHRMQELIADFWTIASRQDDRLRSELPDGERLKILCHSPLSNRLNRVYAEQLAKLMANGKAQYLNKELPERMQCTSSEIPGLYGSLYEGRAVNTGKLRFSAVPAKPKGGPTGSPGGHLKKSGVILASSGMCDHGPSAEYLRMLRDDPRNTIILTGFQASGSAGRELLECSAGGAEVLDLSSHYSGHGDQQRLLDNVFDLAGYSAGSKETTVFINHGESDSKGCLQREILKRAGDELQGDRRINKVLIASDDWFDLNSGSYAQDQKGIRAEIERLQALLAAG